MAFGVAVQCVSELPPPPCKYVISGWTQAGHTHHVPASEGADVEGVF